MNLYEMAPNYFHFSLISELRRCYYEVKHCCLGPRQCCLESLTAFLSILIFVGAESVQSVCCIVLYLLEAARECGLVVVWLHLGGLEIQMLQIKNDHLIYFFYFIISFLI